MAPSTTGATSGSLLKDLAKLFTFKSGKLVNFTTGNLDNLKHDLTGSLNLGLSPPKNVAPHPAAAHPVVTAAETLVGVPTAGGNGNGNGSVQPTPIPEPSTLAFFGLVMGAWGMRWQFARKKCLRRKAA